MTIELTIKVGDNPEELKRAANWLLRLADMPQGGATPLPPPAPHVAVPPPPPLATGAPVEDNEGIPWDKRIHSSSKAKTADGNWRRRRGVTDEEFEKVSNELEYEVNGVDIGPPYVGVSSSLLNGVTVVPQPDAVPPPPPQEVPENMTFAVLADYVTKRLAEDSLTDTQLLECLPEEVTMFTAMAGRSEEELKAAYKAVMSI